MLHYDISNWYWIVDGSTTQVWSSVSRSYVPTTDPAYEAWAESGGVATRITSADLGEVVNGPILEQIAAVEAKQPRPLRDIALGRTDASGSPALAPAQRLAAYEAEIEALRAKLIA